MKPAVTTRDSCPSTKGRSSCTTTPHTCSKPMEAPLAVGMSAIASNGVITTPRTLEAVAATIAAATLPPASEVKVIDDCTVEGTRHRKMSPTRMGAESTESGTASRGRARRGKTTNVVPRMARWSRQFLRPERVSAADSLAP